MGAVACRVAGCTGGCGSCGGSARRTRAGSCTAAGLGAAGAVVAASAGGAAAARVLGAAGPMASAGRKVAAALLRGGRLGRGLLEECRKLR